MNSTVSGADPQAEFKRPESVLVVIYTQAGDALLLQRVRPAWPEFWQSVTGRWHWAEQVPRDAARRELHEETGIQMETGWHDFDDIRKKADLAPCLSLGWLFKEDEKKYVLGIISTS